MKPKIACALALTLLMLLPLASAAGDMGAIVEPVNRIYELIKSLISIVAVLAITFAGVKYMFSGDNMQAREGAKNMLTYAIVGLLIIWVAPPFVGYLTA